MSDNNNNENSAGPGRNLHDIGGLRIDLAPGKSPADYGIGIGDNTKAEPADRLYTANPYVDPRAHHPTEAGKAYVFKAGNHSAVLDLATASDTDMVSIAGWPTMLLGAAKGLGLVTGDGVVDVAAQTATQEVKVDQTLLPSLPPQFSEVRENIEAAVPGYVEMAMRAVANGTDTAEDFAKAARAAGVTDEDLQDVVESSQTYHSHAVIDAQNYLASRHGFQPADLEALAQYVDTPRGRERYQSAVVGYLAGTKQGLNDLAVGYKQWRAARGAAVAGAPRLNDLAVGYKQWRAAGSRS